MTGVPDPADARAVEYALGTLSLEEREAFAVEMAGDPALAASVRLWEARLSPLAERIAALDPSPRLWRRIAEAVGAADSDAPAVIDFAVAAEAAFLRRSRATWRRVAVAAMAAAACLLIAVNYLAFNGPSRLGTPVADRGGLVAVVNRSGELPALIVRVDPSAGTVQVRSLAAETPADRSLELWSIVGGESPHSLGTLSPGATRVAVRDADRPRLSGATVAVTVEPPGGSPTGGPTGPVVYSGKLVAERE